MTESDNRYTSHAAALAGATVGFALEFFQKAPPGVAGIFATSSSIVINEVLARALSYRERARVSSAADQATYRISSRLLAGHLLRDDGFLNAPHTGSSPSQELFEAALMKARDSYEEKKVLHFSLFFANLVFTTSISEQAAHLLLKQMERLTYRQLCLISLVGEKGELDVEHLRRINHIDPNMEALKREEMDLHSNDLGTAGLLTGRGQWIDELSTLGKVMYDLAGLDEVNIADKQAVSEQIDLLRSRS